jgi:phosphoglucomutase/phosphomannomutase
MVSSTPETALIERAVADGRLSPEAGQNLLRWITGPQYADYQARLSGLIAAADWSTLDRWFWEVIPFGTGGRRGLMAELGSATINERTIAESAHGLATYLRRQRPSGGRAVVAHDTRHRSREFAILTATTLAAHGLTVSLFESFRSTPELSLAVRHLQCDVGVMISASHNPPSDNGFKAYWNSGGQVLPPHDQGIIEEVYNATAIPRLDLETAIATGRVQLVGDDIDQAYWSAVLAMSLSSARDIPALFSPLHGVGETSCYEIVRRAGFNRVELFAPHREPDGRFPNVPDHLPNPERPEVFAPLIAHARMSGAEVLLASDPDADRLGCCVRNQAGQFEHLTGNRIGALLADYILRKRSQRGELSPEHFVVETLVTTPLIGAIARSHGVRIVDDLLVGFKYIGETMDALGPQRFVFGAEESLGYLAGTYARDKDAGIAALYLLECAAELRASGQTLLDRLDDLAVAHGYFLEGQFSKTCEGAEGNRQIQLLMRAFRESPPAEIGGLPLTSVQDFGQHEVRTLPANRHAAPLPHPQGNLLIFHSDPLGGSTSRVAVRPSGTEPKIKFYLFARSNCPQRSHLPTVKQQTEELLRGVRQSLAQWIDQTLARASG